MGEDKLIVVVGVDFSEESHRALAWAVDYALRAPCEIHVMHVVEDHLKDVLHERRTRIDEEMTIIVQEAEAELRKMTHARAERSAIGPIHHHVARGKPAMEIVGLAEKLDADMVVVGSHGRGKLKGLLGSTAERVLRYASCPVVCVKTPQ